MALWRIIEQTATAVHLEICTSQRTVEIMADLYWFAPEKHLVLDKVHVEGSGPGTLRRTGLNEAKSALAEFGRQYGAKVVVLQGARRSSGRQLGKVPSVLKITCL